MKDVMIDLETLGTGKDAAIIQVGAVYFDRLTGEVGETFKRNITLESSVAAGGIIDPGTVLWWLGQSKDAQNSILTEGVHVGHALSDLNMFLGDATASWSHASFDMPILISAMNRSNIKPKLHYRATRDIRTLVDLSGVTIDWDSRKGTHHDALDDCMFQIKYCVEAFKILDFKN